MFKTIQIKVGRYGAESFEAFMAQLSHIQKETRVAVPSEVTRAEIRASMREDLRPGVKCHDNGNDVKSLALGALEDLAAPIAKERSKQELAAVKAELALIESRAKELQKRMAELSGERGALNEREIELNQARVAAANREAGRTAKRA